MSISAIETEIPFAQAARVTQDSLHLDPTDRRTISMPLAWYPRLLRAVASERKRWRLLGAVFLLLPLAACAGGPPHEYGSMSQKEPQLESDCYVRGWQKLKEIDGHAGERVIEALQDIAPDLARYTIEFPFGEVKSLGIPMPTSTRTAARVAARASPARPVAGTI